MVVTLSHKYNVLDPMLLSLGNPVKSHEEFLLVFGLFPPTR